MTQQWQAWAQGAQERLLKRVEAVESPRWVDIRSYGLRRSSKLLSSDLFEKVTNAGLPKGEHTLGPEDEVWATQGRANATKVDSIPLNVPGEPIVLLRFRERHWVLDGHHRVARARKEGAELPAVVYDADLQVAKAAPADVEADNLTERDGIHHRTGGRWHHKSGLVKRIAKHLQGKHDQKKHGLRGNRKTTHKDPAQLDAPEFLTKGLSKWLGSKGTFWDGNYKGITVDSEFQSRLTDAYDKMPSYDKKAEGAYSAFRDETSEQFEFLTGELGIRFEVAEDDPYRNVIDATRDVEQNRRLKVYPTAATGGHPFLSDDENDRFRFVHDIMGHVATGRDFDRHGEEAAYLSHAAMYSDEARKALASETRGQNAYLIKRGDFPEQKVALLPDWAWSTGVSKHLMGMHDQDKHAEKQPGGGESSDKGKKGKIQSTLNRLGFERDDNLSMSEKAAFVAGGAALALVIGKRWRNVSDTINSKPVPGVEFPTAAPKPRVKSLDDFVDGDVLDTDFITTFEGGTRDVTLGNIEKSIKGMDREFGFVVGHEGKVHAGFAGSKGMVDVSIPEDLPRSARRKLTVTHNHPSASTLSAPDVDFAIKEQLGSIRAVTPDGNVSELAFTKNFSSSEMHYMQAMTEVSENRWLRRAADEVGRIQNHTGKDKAIRSILTDWDNPLHSSIWSEYAKRFDGVVFARHTGIAKHMLGRHNQKTHGRRHHDMMRFTRDVLGQEVKWDSDTYYNPSGDTMMSLLGGPNPDNFKYKTSSKHPGMALLWNTDTGDSILLSRDKQGRSKMRSIGLPERMIRRGFLAHGNYVAAKETGNRIAQQIGEILPPEMKQRIFDAASARARGPIARHARRTDVRKSIARVIEKHEGPGQHSTGTDQSVHGKGKSGGQLRGEFDPKDSLWTPGKETGEHGIMLAHVGDPVHRYFPDTDIDDSKGLAQTIANATEALRWWNKTDDQGQKYPEDPEDKLARERAYLIDPDGKVVGSMIGIRGAVAIGPDDDPHDGHVFLHNHPSNTSLSLPDIAGAFHNRLGEAHVVADRGGFWAKFKKGGRKGSHDFNEVAAKLTRGDARVKRAVQRMVSDGEVSVYNANKMHPHIVQSSLQRRGMDSYYDYGTDGDPIFNIDLLDPGDEVTKAHGDITLAKGIVPLLDGMPVIVDEYPGAVAEAAVGNPEPLLDVVRVLYRGADIDISRWRDVYHEPVEKRIQQFVSKHLPGQHNQKSHGRRRPATQSKFLHGRIGRSGGYTYQPLVPSSPKEGFAVSVMPEDERMTFGVPTRSNIATFIMRNRDKLEADESLHAGAWYDKKTGRGYLDMSIVTDSKDEAQRLAKEHDQIAFINLKTFDEFDQEGRIRE